MRQAPKVAINGFGRIGRLVTRALLESGKPVDVVAINDLADPEVLAHLFEFDSVHGRFPGTVEVHGEALVVNGDRVRILSEKDPAQLPWGDMDVDYVIEATGRFTTRDGMSKHLEAGAKRVFLSAPGKEVDVTIVRGVNDDAYDPDEHKLISNASCTTNCLAPVLKVLHDAFGVEQATMTTIHAYTNDQVLLDSPHKDLRRARAGAVSMIPTSTGAARAIGLVLPELEGKVDGMAVRVPLVNGSLVDVNVHLKEGVTREDVEGAFSRAASGSLKGILDVATKPLVSVDFNHDAHSAIVDFPSLMVVNGKPHPAADRDGSTGAVSGHDGNTGSLVKVLAWYDNEWAYSVRLAELVLEAWYGDVQRTEAGARARGTAQA